MSMRKSLILILHSLLWVSSFNLSLYAQTPTPSIESSPNPPFVSQAQPSKDAEVAALRAQIETMRQYDEKLLATVYWSLGSMGAIIVLVVGLGWYTNFRLYERDKAAMQKEVESSLATIRKDLMDSLTHEARSAGKAAVERMQTEFAMIKYDLSELEAGKWESKGVYENALMRHLKMIEAAQLINYDTHVGRALEHMQRVLKARIKKFSEQPPEVWKPEFEAQLAVEITEMLDNLPKGFSVIADNIRELLRRQ